MAFYLICIFPDNIFYYLIICESDIKYKKLFTVKALIKA